MSYARVLFVGGMPCREADYAFRLCEALRGGGHAVRVCERPDEGGDGRALRAALEAFRPTLVVWDVLSVDAPPHLAALRGAPCLRAALLLSPEGAGLVPEGAFDAVICAFGDAGAAEASRATGLPALPLGFAPDAPYRDALVSDPSPLRRGVSCTQPRSEAAESALAALGDVPQVLTSPTWPHSLEAAVPGAVPAHWLRTARYAAFFDAPGLTCSSLCMRMAEGALVLVEAPAAAGIPDADLRAVVPTFERGRLAEALSAYEADPAARDAALARQRALLGGLAPLGDSLAGLLDGLDGVCARVGSAPVRSLGEGAVEVVLFGWFGAHNFGDDLLMSIVIDRVERRFENAVVSVIGADAGALRTECGLAAMTPDQRWAVRHALSRARAVVFCGGLVFDDPLARTAGELELFLDPWIEPTGQAAVSILARLHGVPSVYLGIGAGPLRNGETRAAVRAIALAGSLLLPRDAETCRLFEEAGVPRDLISPAADLALGSRDYLLSHADPEPPECARGDHFVISLRDWHLNPPGFERAVARLVDRLARDTGCRPVLVPFDADDVGIHRRVRAAMGVDATLLEERPPEGRLLALMRGSRFGVAMRLHCSIIHHVLGKPVIGLDYNDKIHAHFSQLGQGRLLLPLGFGDEEASRAAASLRDALREGDESLARLLGEREGRVGAAFDRLWEAMGSASPVDYGREVYYPRRVSRFESDLILARGRISELERELADRGRLCDEAMGEAARVRGSHSYRLGNALLRVPALLRDRLLGRPGRHRGDGPRHGGAAHL